MKSQSENIIRYLKAGECITHIEALNLFGCARLAARIKELREQGYNIITETVNKNGKSFASYKLVTGRAVQNDFFERLEGRTAESKVKHHADI